MDTRRTIAALLLMTCAGVRLHAQQPESPLAAARAKTELSEEDRNQIRAFVSQRVGEIVGEDADVAREAAKALREGFSGSDPFKQAYGAITIELAAAAVKRAELVPAARLLTLLRTINTLDARTAFVEALADDRVGVRAAAAVGLRSLRPKIAASPDAYTGVVAALKEAGKKEKSRETLRAIYGALDFAELPGSPDLRPVAVALLELLEERAKLYAPHREVPAVGADDAGLGVAEHLLKALPEEERKRLIVVVAGMTRWGIEEYCSSPRKLTEVRDATAHPQLIEYRDSVERLVLQGERLLAALLSPSKTPSVLDGMRKLNKAEMRLQWKEWNELLKAAVGQDFTLVEVPASEQTP